MGHRVELGEIEACADGCEGVVRSCCMFDKQKGKLLMFYMGAADEKTLGKYLRSMLPRYMLPSKIKRLDALPLLENGDVLLERQFRYAMREVLTEIPAGKLDYIGEDPHEAALRELREETGAVASELIPLGPFYPTCAYSTEVIHMFLARGLTFGERDLDEDEFLNVFRLPLRELVEKVLNGEIPDAKTQAAALRVWCMLKEGKLP